LVLFSLPYIPHLGLRIFPQLRCQARKSPVAALKSQVAQDGEDFPRLIVVLNLSRLRVDWIYQGNSSKGDFSMKRSLARILIVLAVAGSVTTSLRAQFPGYPSPGMIPAGGLPSGGYPPMMGAMPPGSFDNGVVPAGYCGGGGCDVGSCDCSCTSPGACEGGCGCKCPRCCVEVIGYQHCWHLFGEFLYLRPRDSEVVWATPANSNFPVPPNPAPVQIGPLGVLDMDYQVGFRAGFQYNMTECTGVSIQYTFFESTTEETVGIGGANVLESNVSHPGIDTTAQNFRLALGDYNINYDMVDVDYHELLWYDYDYQFGYLAGINVVQMEQRLNARFAGNGTETVRTDVDFYGAGARFGFEGEAGRGGRFRVYGKGIGSLVVGEFRADYDLGHSFDAVVVDTAWHGGRIVGIWNLEFGAKWVSCCGNYSANLGYMFSAWTNTVQTDQWIRAVQSNSYVDLDDTMTFDGLVARVEVRF
jgi:hypothetical protein